MLDRLLGVAVEPEVRGDLLLLRGHGRAPCLCWPRWRTPVVGARPRFSTSPRPFFRSSRCPRVGLDLGTPGKEAAYGCTPPNLNRRLRRAIDARRLSPASSRARAPLEVVLVSTDLLRGVLSCSSLRWATARSSPTRSIRSRAPTSSRRASPPTSAPTCTSPAPPRTAPSSVAGRGAGEVGLEPAAPLTVERAQHVTPPPCGHCRRHAHLASQEVHATPGMRRSVGWGKPRSRPGQPLPFGHDGHG